MARQGPDPGEGTARFGPVAGAPGGGAVLGGLVFTIGVDGSLVRPTLEESRQIAAQLAPSIQKLLNLELRVNTDAGTAQLKAFEAQAQAATQRIQRSFDSVEQAQRRLGQLQSQGQRLGVGGDPIGTAVADAQRRADVAASAARQATVAARFTLPPESNRIGFDPSGPLSARAFANANLPPLDTLAFRRSTEEAVASLRGVATASEGAAGSVRSAFSAAGQAVSSVGQDIGRSWSSGLRSVVVGVAAFEAAERALGAIVENSRDANQALFTLNKSFGEGAPQAKAYAESIGPVVGQSIASIEKADAELQRIGRVVGLTRDQVLRLGQLSLDIAAVSGRTPEQAGHAVAAAFLGQPRGLDVLGVPATQAILKSSGELAAARERDASATELQTRSQALYNLVLKEAAPLQGAAKERADDAAGAFDRLGASFADATGAIGQGDNAVTKATGLLAGLFELISRGERSKAEDAKTWADYWESVGGGPLGVLQRRLPELPVGPHTPTVVPAVDVADPEQRRLRSILATPPTYTVPLTPSEEFSAALGRQTTAAEAAKKSTADLIDEQQRHAQITEMVRHAVIDSARADADEATRHRAVSIALRERATTLEKLLQLEQAQQAAIFSAAEFERGGSKTAALARATETAHTDAQAKAVAAQQAVSQALAGATPSFEHPETDPAVILKGIQDERARLARQLEAAGETGAAAAQRALATDPAQQQADRIRAVTQAEQARQERQKQVTAELLREGEQRARRDEDKHVQDLRDAQKGQLEGIENLTQAERDRHDAAVRGLQDEAEARQRVAQSQERQLDLDQRLADTGRTLADAQARLAQAQTGPGVPGDRSRTTGQRAQGIRDAQAAVDAASTQAALAALEAGGLGGAGILTPAQRQQAIASLRAGLATRTDLDPAASVRATQLLYEASLPPSQVPAADRAAIDQALRGQIGREQEKADRADRDAQRQEERLNRDNTKSLADAAKDSREASDKQITAAERQNVAARDQRETAAAWARIFGPGTPGAAAAAASVNATPPAPGSGGSSTAAGVSPGPPPAGTAYGVEGATVIFNGPVSVGGKEGGEALAKQIVAGIQQARQQTGATA